MRKTTLFEAVARSAVAAAVAGGLAFGGAASAKGVQPPQSVDIMADLYAQAAGGAIDAQLPVVLDRLKRAVATRDLVAVLDLIEPRYFEQQFNFLHRGERAPGETLAQFTCEFFFICSVEHHYRFPDIAAVEVVSVDAAGGGLLSVNLRLTMSDGVRIDATVYYSTETKLLSAGVG